MLTEQGRSALWRQFLAAGGLGGSRGRIFWVIIAGMESSY